MKKAEIILVGVAIISTIFRIMHLIGAHFLTVLSFTFLSCLYFYFSFAIFNGIRFRDIFKKASYQGISALRIIGAIVTGIAISMAIVGMEFRIMRWPGASIMLMVGGLVLCLLTVTAIIKYFSSKAPFYLNILKRVVPYTILAVVAFISVKFRG